MRLRLKTNLATLFQEHLIEGVDRFSDEAVRSCLTQLSQWDPAFVLKQKRSWSERRMKQISENLSGKPFFAKERFSNTASLKPAVVILAGGQGSRLGWHEPKGCFPLLGKSLFERILSQIKPSVPVAVMTSLLNHAKTVSFFEEHHFFGRKGVLFFSQTTAPLLDENGLWFWEKPGRIAEGADGNGSVFRALADSGTMASFEDDGVEVLHVLAIDNPLAKPLDPCLSSFHEDERADVTVCCIEVNTPNEAMGRLVLVKNSLAILEFAELSEEERAQYLLANTGRFIFDFSIVKELSTQEFPWHWAFRTTPVSFPYVETKKIWKAERFIVDSLFFAKKPHFLKCSRQECYAPLKDLSSILGIEKLLESETRRLL